MAPAAVLLCRAGQKKPASGAVRLWVGSSRNRPSSGAVRLRAAVGAVIALWNLENSRRHARKLHMSCAPRGCCEKAGAGGMAWRASQGRRRSLKAEGADLSLCGFPLGLPQGVGLRCPGSGIGDFRKLAGRSASALSQWMAGARGLRIARERRSDRLAWGCWRQLRSRCAASHPPGARQQSLAGGRNLLTRRSVRVMSEPGWSDADASQGAPTLADGLILRISGFKKMRAAAVGEPCTMIRSGPLAALRRRQAALNRGGRERAGSAWVATRAGRRLR